MTSSIYRRSKPGAWTSSSKRSISECSPRTFATLIAPLAQKNGNTLNLDVPADIGVMHTDLTKLKQCLVNLLSNASKFTQNGTIALKMRREAIAERTRFIFRVADTGIGMSAEQKGRLFQAFTQADASTTRNYGGTGLGLTISKHFCTMLGGTIDVQSEPGKRTHCACHGRGSRQGDGCGLRRF